MMNPKNLRVLKARLIRWVALGAMALAFVGVSSFSNLNATAMAEPLYHFPVMAASSAANQVKGQVDRMDRAIGDVKDNLDSAAKDTARKTKDLADQAKGKQSAVGSKAKRDIAKTQEAAENAKAALASRTKQDASKAEGALEQAGNKAEEFASNALDTAKNLLGQ
jgi:multidrug resistance efflux pump